MTMPLSALMVLAILAPGETGGAEVLPERVPRAVEPQRPAPGSPVACQDQAGRAEGPSNAEAVCGTWVLQQVTSREELDRLLPTTLVPALETPAIRGFSMRVPWRAIDGDFALLDAGLAVARRRPGLLGPVHGRASYPRPRLRGRLPVVPAPRRAGPRAVPAHGAPNAGLRGRVRAVRRPPGGLVPAHGVRLLHLAWYGQDWAELNHGKEVRARPGYSYANWLRAHVPAAGHRAEVRRRGPGRRAAVLRLRPADRGGGGPGRPRRRADRPGQPDLLLPGQRLGAGRRLGVRPMPGRRPRSTGSGGGRSAAASRPSSRATTTGRPCIGLSENAATYCEVYAPSFLKGRKDRLAAEIETFADRCKERVPLPSRTTAVPGPE